MGNGRWATPQLRDCLTPKQSVCVSSRSMAVTGMDKVHPFCPNTSACHPSLLVLSPLFPGRPTCAPQPRLRCLAPWFPSPALTCAHHRTSSCHIPCCCCSVAQSCPTLCDPMDCSPIGFPVLPSPGLRSNSCA